MRKERQKGREERKRWEIIERIDLFILFVGVGSQIAAHTLMEIGNGPNEPNTINL